MNTFTNNKKINIVIDLDQTIISSIEHEIFNKNSAYSKKMKYFSHKNMDDCFYIFERPYLHEFLDFIFENFNVSIWTAASKGYALFIIEHIILKDKPNRKIDYIFYSDHCDLSKDKTGNTKDLSMLWTFYKLKGYNKKNTFIIDDYDEVYNTQRNNCIIVKPFEFTDKNSEEDIYLLTLIPYLRKILETNSLKIIPKINSM